MGDVIDLSHARNERELLSDDDKERELTRRGIVPGAHVRDPLGGEGIVIKVGRGVKPFSRLENKPEDFYVTVRRTNRTMIKYDLALMLHALADPDD
jgi:tRNA A58 N-methylase Trm61